MKSPFRAIDNDQMHKILAQEAEVLKIAKLTDSDKLFNLETAFTRLSIQATVYSQSLPEQKYNKLLTWLSVLPYNNHHQFVSQSRMPGLGTWLLNHEDYIEWQTSSSSSMLLLHGITGSGKSALCSVIVDSFSSAANTDPFLAPFAYFYCANPDFEKARCSPDDIMRSLLGQLSLGATEECKIKDFLCSEYDRQVAKTRVNGLDLLKLRTQDCVRLILELAEQDPITIIIDAIDTIEEIERHSLMSALEMVISEADNVVKILITSRSSACARVASVANKRIQITRQEAQQDMTSFVSHLIDEAASNMLLLEGNVSSALRDLLVKTLLDGAGEM